MSRRGTKTDIVDFLAENVLNRKVGPNDYLRLTWNGGYFTLEERGLEPESGGISFSGSHHPGDGLCHANDSDTPDGRDGTCIHCGTTLM